MSSFEIPAEIRNLKFMMDLCILCIRYWEPKRNVKKVYVNGVTPYRGEERWLGRRLGGRGRRGWQELVDVTCQGVRRCLEREAEPRGD